VSSLKSKFHDDMVKIYLTAKKELHYCAKRFFQLVVQHGGLVAAKRLISKEGATYGFEFFGEQGRLDLSVEALVLKPEYAELFTEYEKEKCRSKLQEFGYDAYCCRV